MCFRESRVTSNHSTRPHFPWNMVPAPPYGLGRHTANAGQKACHCCCS
jgi:hypothetical protein